MTASSFGIVWNPESNDYDAPKELVLSQRCSRFIPTSVGNRLLSLHGRKGYAFVRNKARAESLYQQAQSLGLDINYPLTPDDLREQQARKAAGHEQ